jgi:hypothetical protein
MGMAGSPVTSYELKVLGFGLGEKASTRRRRDAEKTVQLNFYQFSGHASALFATSL